jgi:spore coat protein CotH
MGRRIKKMNGKELIWVEKEFAERYNKLEAKANQREEQIAIFEEYMKTVSEKSKDEFKANLEALEEDAAMYTGLMLKVKQTFEKAMSSSFDSAYTIWESYDKERSKAYKQVTDIVKVLEPLEEKLNTINKLAGKIETWNIDRLIHSLDALNNLTEKSENMFKFLVDNFKDEKKA